MLVTFSCDAYENITMFGDVAKRLIVMMGHSDTVPGAILAKDIPAALENLQNNLAKMPSPSPSSADDDDEDEEPEISLAHRAIPLINMLQAARKNQSNLIWQ